MNRCKPLNYPYSVNVHVIAHTLLNKVLLSKFKCQAMSEIREVVNFPGMHDSITLIDIR
jgi:hypothetical protein